VSKPFLNVARSLSGHCWQARLDDSRIAEAISQKHELPHVLGCVLASRRVGLEEVETYLNPTLRALMPQPSQLADMEKGAQRLAYAITHDRKIGIIGDYDVDGLCSVALMLRFLRAVGSDAALHIPDRIVEGYGPSLKAVESLKARGTQLLLTLDCGVMAHDPLAQARELGMDIVIVDHHQAGETLPRAHAVINPNRQDDISGFGYLCAAGLTMILIATVNRQLRAQGWYIASRPEPNLLQWLELVALATVCDVVPLTGLNRAYVTQGLKIMARRENIGLAALAEQARLRRAADCYALGFLLGPRLNAAGRIGDALLGLKLLTTHDRGEANAIAAKLESLNRDRQTIELQVLDQAAAQAEAMLAKAAGPVIIVAGEGWHPGVLGLAAARLKERFNLPSIVLSHEPGSDIAAGSGRSIAGIDLGSAIRAAQEAGLIVKGGGHAMAAGLTVRLDRLGDLRAFLQEKLAEAAILSRQRTLSIDGALTASGATLDLIELLDQAGPYGAANPAPVFAFPAHRIVFADSAGADHVRCTIAAQDGARLKAIAFRALGTELGETLLSERQHPLHFAGRLTIDEWNGKRAPALHIEDIAAPS
jgi:single-stranded-DNA-specific exonuclease